MILDFKFRHVSNVLFSLVGDSRASEFYVPTFRNTLFQLHRWCKLPTTPMKVEQTVFSETSTHKIRTPGNHPIERIKILWYFNKIFLGQQ